MKPRTRVLYIGHDTADAALAELVLSREYSGIEVPRVTDPVAFGREVERGEFDMAICEEQIEWAGLTRVLLEIRSRRPEAAVVVLSESEGQKAADLTIDTREAALIKSSEAFLALPGLLAAALERAQASETAARLEPRVHALLQRTRIGVFRLTLDGRLLEADQTFLEIFGVHSLEEASGLDFSDLTPQLPRGFTESGKLYRREVKTRGAGANDIWVALTEVVSLDESGLPVLDGLLEDVGERRAASGDSGLEAERLANANEELRMFASLAAHELKEPLRTIEQSTRMLMEDAGPDLESEALESGEMVVQGVRRLQSMVDGLLTMARVGGDEENIGACDSSEIVREVLVGLEARIEESQAKVRVKALPTVQGDPVQLRLLFQNLIGNALKFHGDEPPKVEIAAHQEDDDWVFSVKDQGVGVSPKEVERIFKRFARGGDGAGAGLGLAICRQVVERHGGRIWVESEPGRGSTFFFTIPLAGSGSSESPGRGEGLDEDRKKQSARRRKAQGDGA